MKYVVLIHSNPQPWGHPTIDFTEVGRAVPADERAAMGKEFDEMLAELSASGELVTGLALDAPSTARTYRWEGKRPVNTASSGTGVSTSSACERTSTTSSAGRPASKVARRQVDPSTRSTAGRARAPRKASTHLASYGRVTGSVTRIDARACRGRAGRTEPGAGRRSPAAGGGAPTKLPRRPGAPGRPPGPRTILGGP